MLQHLKLAGFKILHMHEFVIICDYKIWIYRTNGYKQVAHTERGKEEKTARCTDGVQGEHITPAGEWKIKGRISC